MARAVSRSRALAPRARGGLFALSPWKIETDGDEVVIGDLTVDLGTAKDLWVRLGVAIGEAERNTELRAWVALEEWLTWHFQGAHHAQGEDVRHGKRARGLLRRDGEKLALFRIATYCVVHLRPKRNAPTWEGPIMRYRPGTIAVGEIVATTRRVRVEADAVLGAPLIDRQLGRIPPRALIP